MTDSSITAQLVAIARLPTPELRTLWQEYFGKYPPLLGRHYMIARLSYRAQELHFGGPPAYRYRDTDLQIGTARR